MKTTWCIEGMIEWIDNASYEQLLRRWRFAPIGSPWFAGKVGEHYVEIMNKRRSETSNCDQVRASKIIGWETGLKNCPCCGGSARIIDVETELPNGTKDIMYRVECTVRECGLRTNDWFPKESAIRVWNRRAVG
jgi:hypothetical protein